MSRFVFAASLLGLAALLLIPSTSSAQWVYTSPFGPQLVPVQSTLHPVPFVGGFGAYYGVPTWGAWNSYGATLQGMADLTRAQGQYWQDIQQARLLREQSRQASIDTRRKQLQWELEYEQFRATAPKLMARQQATDLDWARYHAQQTEVWSGRPLNVLLQSILRSPNPIQGPYISLTQQQLRGINLTDGSTCANLTMTKNQGKIVWPEALQAEPFDQVRDNFTKSFEVATRSIESGKQPSIQTLRSLRTDLNAIDDKLVAQVDDLAPSRFIEGRRLVRQLRETVDGMSNQRLVNSSRSDWRQNIRTVADLVSHMKTNGLEFGPAAAPGDHAAYTAVFQALRQYERGVKQLARK